MTPNSADPHILLERITLMVTRLIDFNSELLAENTELYDHIESLKTRLDAPRGDNSTLTQQANAAQQELQAEADRDHQRLERLRAELDAYLSEIDQRISARQSYV